MTFNLSIIFTTCWSPTNQIEARVLIVSSSKTHLNTPHVFRQSLSRSLGIKNEHTVWTESMTTGKRAGASNHSFKNY